MLLLFLLLELLMWWCVDVVDTDVVVLLSYSGSLLYCCCYLFVVSLFVWGGHSNPLRVFFPRPPTISNTLHTSVDVIFKTFPHVHTTTSGINLKSTPFWAEIGYLGLTNIDFTTARVHDRIPPPSRSSHTPHFAWHVLRQPRDSLDQRSIWTELKIEGKKWCV